ncbi:lipoate-protein ligase A [Clostridiales Family XIII bacterium PM5-7]
MMPKGSRFIYTNSETIKETLEKSKYPLIKQTSGGYWVFLNKNEINFSKKDDVILTDRITF